MLLWHPLVTLHETTGASLEASGMLSPQNILQQGVPCTPCCFLSRFLPQVPFDAPQYFGCRRQRPQFLASWGEFEARHHTPVSPPSFQAEAGHRASRYSPATENLP